MGNRSKKIGTEGESAVVKACHRAGFTDARRIELRGMYDAGDVEVVPGLLMLQVKAGQAGRTASDNQIIQWWLATKEQQERGKYEDSFLVLHRTGVGVANAERWWCIDVETVVTPGGEVSMHIVRRTLGHVLHHFAANYLEAAK